MVRSGCTQNSCNINIFRARFLQGKVSVTRKTLQENFAKNLFLGSKRFDTMSLGAARTQLTFIFEMEIFEFSSLVQTTCNQLQSVTYKYK